MFLHNIGRIYWSNHVLSKGVHFVLSYSTQRWYSYVAGNLFKKKTGNMKQAYNKDKTRSINLKR